VPAVGDELEIRPYRESDERDVAALWREIFAEESAWNNPERDIWRKLKVQRELFMVALEGGRVVGTSMAGYDGHRGWVYYVAVSPRHRKHGIARALMSRVEDELKAVGCPKINLQVRAGNIGAVAFYRKLGYRIEERVSLGKRLIEDRID
jgi:ribosomal protein S18 acetylase RimI-like enzyme